MSIDGNWAIEIATAMGTRKAKLALATSPDGISGTFDNGDEVVPIEGTLEGGTATWPVKLSKPFPMTLKFTATAEGDAISGRVKAGPMGTAPMKGTRIDAA